jgi:hypothetical protein
MTSLLHTGTTLLLKIEYTNGAEKVIGFAKSLSYTVSQGQKTTYGVDSPFPVEIAQGAAPSSVRGSLVTYLPKGSSPESMGLVPYRHDVQGSPINAGSRYMALKVYDRATGKIVFICEFCKVGSYSVNVMARGVVECAFQFEGMFVTPG